MKISVEKTAEVLVFHAGGRLDSMTVGEFEREVTTLILQSKQNALIDLEKLDYISSAGLRSILVIAKEMKKNGNNLVLCCLNETIKEVFHISGFDTFISICPTIQAGLTFLK